MREDLVVADELAVAYGEGALRTSVFEGATFRIPRHRVTAVTGPSGCGKTTLLSLLGGLERADRGSLRVGGRDLCTMTGRELIRYRQAVAGFVFQFFHLLPTLDARENVEAGLDPLGLDRRERRRRAAEALDAVGLAALQRRFPHELSGGQQQRVAVARAWAKRPPLLLADEPTGNLDEEQSRDLLELLVRSEGADGTSTLVIATHDPAVAARADHHLVLRGGHVTATTDYEPGLRRRPRY